MKKSVPKLFLAVSVFLVASLCIFIGFVAGNKFAYSYSSNIASTGSEVSQEDMSLFWQAYEKLKSQYIGEIDKEDFIYGAISGAFASLDDPYTVFLSPKVSEEFSKELAGELEGIGIKIGVLDNFPTVIAPLKDSPAYKAGVKAKDRIMKVDDLETEGQPIDLIVSKIRGPEGSKVTLELLRDDEFKKIEITREKIAINTVELSITDGIAHLVISEFGIQTSSEFAQAAKQIEQKGINKVVIDLRNNPGGILDETIKVAGYLFNPDTPVVVEKGRNIENIHKTFGPGTLKNVKIAVLVNEGSASAAEILAGAIKDNNRGNIIGTKTFGKGTVQQLDYLPQGTSVKITVAKWLTPGGHDIDKNGINPDEEVQEEDDRLFSKADPVFDAAVKNLAKK
jgi:carboxyl-terminal processing protease